MNIFFRLICLSAVIFLLFADLQAQCDSERWNVKTGIDSDAALVNLLTINPTSIANLTSLPTPANIPVNSRIQPTELTTFSLSATLVKYVRSFDSDYHLVIKDEAGRTMIAEIPDPACVNANSPFYNGISRARSQFNAVFNATNTFQTANVPVQIVGVGFFDYNEGQDGIAPNGIELHPIIDITFGPTFSLTSSASNLNIKKGNTGSAVITSTISGNFNAPVQLSVTGLPNGTTASFSPAFIAAPGAGSANLTVSVGSNTPLGTYNLVVTGNGNGQTHTVPVNLTVLSNSANLQLIGNAGFENGSANPAPWIVSSGVIDNSSFQSPHTGSWKAWLNGFGAVHTDTLYQQVSIPSDATSASLSFWMHIETAETTKTSAFDTLKLQIKNSSGAVLTTLATYSNLNAAVGYTQKTFDLLAYKGQTIQIYLVGTEDSNLKTSFVLDDFALNVAQNGNPTPDFSLSASPNSLSISKGNTGVSAITSTISGNFNAPVTLSATGLSNGTTASFSPASIAAPGSGSSNLNISVGASTAAGNYTVQITGNGGGITRTTSINLTVTSGGSTQQLIGNAGFENGSANPAPWIVSSGVIDNSSFQSPHTGSWKAWLNGFGAVHTDTLYQQVSIPSDATSASLSFWMHIETAETTTTAAYDTLKLQIRNSTGQVLATLVTYSNLNSAAGYTQKTFDLLAYKGQTIQIYLVGTEDSSLKTSFVLDDFLLNVNRP